MNINLSKVAKIAGFILPAIGAFAAGWANMKDNELIVAKTTEKLFKEYVKNK